jgi:hypothetical protein
MNWLRPTVSAAWVLGKDWIEATMVPSVIMKVSASARRCQPSKPSRPAGLLSVARAASLAGSGRQR